MPLSTVVRALARPPLALLWLTLPLVLIAAAPGHGQSLVSGTLTGVVRDTLANPLYDVRVVLRAGSTGFERETTTSRDGRFAFEFVAAGEYELAAEGIGFRPILVQGLPVGPGRRVDVPVVLTGSAPPVERIDTVTWRSSALLGAASGVLRRFDRDEARRLPTRRREVTELSRLASVVDADFAIEGLPASLSGLWVDGMLVSAPSAAAGWGAPLSAAAFPFSAFSGARLLGADPDVERSGAAGAAMSVRPRRGTSDFRVDAFGSWTRGEVASGAAIDPTTGSMRDLQGGVVVSGPLRRDTASFVAGVELWRLESPLARGFGSDSLARAIGAIARDSFGLTLDESGSAGLASTEVVSLFGRVDWRVAPNHALSVGGNAAVVPSTSTVAGWGGPLSGGGAPAGDRLFANATLSSILTPTVLQEIRVGFQRSSGDSPFGDETPIRTRIVSSGFVFGPDAASADALDQSLASLNGTWHLAVGAHRVKLGLSGALASYERDPSPLRWGEFRFAGPDEFARGEGTFVGVSGAANALSFDVPRFGAFVQDSWMPAAGLELTAGVRYDVEMLPVGDVELNPAWLEHSGLANADVQSRAGTLSPRLGFLWDVGAMGRWLLRGSGGVYAGYADPRALGDLLTDDGRWQVQRGAGELTGWPAAPVETVAPLAGSRLTMLARGYRGPRSLRGSLGVSRFLGGGTVFHLDASYRRTDQLGRTVDLNLSPVPSARDQFGRPVFGELRQENGLLTVESGSNRRFSDFDVVAATNLDGWSEYRAVTLGVEREMGERFGFFGSYTYSRTTDNWLFPYDSGEIILPPSLASGGNDDWSEGTSDLDRPHRLVAGAELEFGPVGLAALYRYQSGAPFTPGFRDGVDANGDGSGRNDVAFISESVPGMGALLSDWGCLGRQREALVERNSCRSDGAQTIDARLTLRIAPFGGAGAELFVDGLNLVDSGYTQPDAAVYLLDPAGTVEHAADGTVTLPLIANPDFGTPLVRFRPGRQFRLGLRIGH